MNKAVADGRAATAEAIDENQEQGRQAAAVAAAMVAQINSAQRELDSLRVQNERKNARRCRIVFQQSLTH